MENFLCEDSCICGHVGQTVEVRQSDTGEYLFFCRAPPPLNSLSLIHSAVSCPLFLVVYAPFPAVQPLLFTPLPLCSIHHTTEQSAVCKSRHPVQSNNALSSPSQLGIIPPSSLCVRSCVVAGIMCERKEDIIDFFFLCVHSNWWMPELTTWAFPVLQRTLIILPTSLWNSNDLKNGWYWINIVATTSSFPRFSFCLVVFFSHCNCRKSFSAVLTWPVGRSCQSVHLDPEKSKRNVLLIGLNATELVQHIHDGWWMNSNDLGEPPDFPSCANGRSKFSLRSKSPHNFHNGLEQAFTDKFSRVWIL